MNNLPAQPPGISKTSIYVAAGRAMGAREPDESVRNPDYLAERLLGDPAALGVDHPAVHALGQDYAEAIEIPEVKTNVIMMMIRTRFIDDALRRWVAAGASQVMLLGAGFDTRAYRFADLLKDTPVFEVDRPRTQELKRRRAGEALGAAPANLTYVPVDFQHQDLAEVLRRHGHDPARKTFFIWEGVSMYLPEPAVRSTLSFVASHAGGSTIVFDFVRSSFIERIASIDIEKVPEPMRPAVQRLLNLVAGEPWIFGLPDDGEREYLEELGLEVREILAVGGQESVQRYLTRADGTIFGGLPSGPRPGPQMSVYQLAEAIVPV